MTEKLKQIVKEEMMKLSKDTQEAINSFDWASITEEIGKKYLLSESEINDLQVETLLALLGLVDLDFYATSIENNVGTTKDDAIKIAGEAFAKIFTPIYDKLEENIKKNLQGKNLGWQETLNFILSGGDYSAFTERRDDTINTTPRTPLVRGDTTPPRPNLPLGKGEVTEGVKGRGF